MDAGSLKDCEVITKSTGNTPCKVNVSKVKLGVQN